VRRRDFAAAAGAFLALAASAEAHALLEHARPAAGAVLNTAPSELRLSFSERVEPALCSVALADEAGHALALAAPVATAGARTLVARIDTTLAPGLYRVRWRAVSVDTHVTEGAFSFRIAP
jgi:copper resistance protein C